MNIQQIADEVGPYAAELAKKHQERQHRLMLRYMPFLYSQNLAGSYQQPPLSGLYSLAAGLHN